MHAISRTTTTVALDLSFKVSTLLFLCLSLYLLPIASTSFASNPFEADISHAGPSLEDDTVQTVKGRNKRGNYNSYYQGRLRYSRPITQTKVQQHIVSEHNKFRKMVDATNMEYMFWDSGLAQEAQRHADRCDFLHSRDRRRNVGENIWAAPFYNFNDAVRLWYIERHTCSYCPDAFNHCCGHYTQVVWSNSNKIGCGFAECSSINAIARRHRYILVCQYSPAGNKIGPGGPRQAFRRQHGNYGACSECPDYASRCHDGLCIP